MNRINADGRVMKWLKSNIKDTFPSAMAGSFMSFFIRDLTEILSQNPRFSKGR
jgi:hypothetical protein